MIPPVSPFGLLQETLWPNHWLILVASMLLNCTSRKQVEKVLPEFSRRWPDPRCLLVAQRDDVAMVCKTLGFANRRTKNLIEMTKAYMAGDWKHANELPGIGDYGARSWEIFCAGIIGDEPPVDHALVQYFNWVKRHGYMLQHMG